MRHKLNSTIEVLRKNGLESGASIIISEAMRYFNNLYWDIRGTQSFSVNNVTATFGARTDQGGPAHRKRFREEKGLLTDFLLELNDDDIVFDVGANTGIYTCFSGLQCSNGSVVAFEPYPPNVGELKENIHRNRLNNIQVCDFALSDTGGSITFQQPESEKVGYGSSSISTDNLGKVKVNTRRSDQLIESGEVPQPTVVKIDVEGAEPLVIDGMVETLTDDRCRLVYCEVHLPHDTGRRPSAEDFGSDLTDIKTKLRDFGFQVEELGQRHDEIMLKATHNQS